MTDSADAHLREVVERALPDADDATVSIVAACAGLLGCVAYADRHFSEEEAEKIDRLLSTIEGIGPDGARAIVQALQLHRIELARVHSARFSRTLRELADRDLRVHVLSMLLELAASDSSISQSETNTLRQVTGGLGLEQRDYNELQSKHREKLGTLR
jgi:uncharacterized tellurite resistance protein B-like protein